MIMIALILEEVIKVGGPAIVVVTLAYYGYHIVKDTFRNARIVDVFKITLIITVIIMAGKWYHMKLQYDDLGKAYCEAYDKYAEVYVVDNLYEKLPKEMVSFDSYLSGSKSALIQSQIINNGINSMAVYETSRYMSIDKKEGVWKKMWLSYDFEMCLKVYDRIEIARGYINSEDRSCILFEDIKDEDSIVHLVGEEEQNILYKRGAFFSVVSQKITIKNKNNNFVYVKLVKVSKRLPSILESIYRVGQKTGLCSTEKKISVEAFRENSDTLLMSIYEKDFALN